MYMQRLMSDYKYAMSKWDNAETTLKLKVPKLENEYKILVKKYQEIKEKNSELVCNYICKLHAVYTNCCRNVLMHYYKKKRTIYKAKW